MNRTPTFVDPLSDWGFKKILAAEQNKQVLISVLNCIIDDRVITDIVYLNTEHTYQNVPKGKSVFDIYCQCQDGSRIIIEMQNQEVKLFPSRVLAYSAMSILDQAKAKWKYDFDKVYFIAFLKFNLFKDSSNWFHKLALTEQEAESPFVYENYLQIYVELSKFAEKVDSRSSLRDKLIFSMKDMGTSTTLPAFINEEEIIRFYDAARFNTLSSEEQSEYIEEMLKEEDYRDAMDFAIERAEKRGMEKGMEKGIAEGKIQMTQQIVSRMKDLGISEDEICKITGFPFEEVSAICGR